MPKEPVPSLVPARLGSPPGVGGAPAPIDDDGPSAVRMAAADVVESLSSGSTTSAAEALTTLVRLVINESRID